MKTINGKNPLNYSYTDYSNSPVFGKSRGFKTIIFKLC